MAILDPETKDAVKNFLNKIEGQVKINVFTSNSENLEANEVAKELIQELSEISDNKIIFEEKNRRSDTFYMRTPRFNFGNKENINFVGLPLGNEFQVFLETVKIIGDNKVELSSNVKEKISAVNKNLKLLIFVTPTCPHCVSASRDSIKFAFLNNNIETYVIEITEFPELAEKFNIFAVPKIVVLDNNNNVLTQWEGALPTKYFAEKIKNL